MSEDAFQCFPFNLPAQSHSPFLQLFTLGSVWVFLHCGPMCGPIVSGLNLKSSKDFFLYEFGRAQVYGVLGAFAGYLGEAIELSPKFGWLLVAVVLLLALVEAFPQIFSFKAIPQWVVKLASRLNQLSASRRAYSLGLLFAFLPCGLSLWALTLAAATRNPWEGAIIMILLVGLSLVPLFLVRLGFRALIGRRARPVTLGLLLVSLSFTTLVVLASNGYIEHQHFSFSFGSREYTLMFW